MRGLGHLDRSAWFGALVGLIAELRIELAVVREECEWERAEAALELLRRAGWVPGRRVAVEEMVRALAAAGHVVVPPAREFLAECSGLVIVSADGGRVVRIDGRRAARGADPGWCAAYGDGIGRAVTPVAGYSHMTLLIDEAGAFWGGFDADYGFKGDGIIAVVHGLLVEPGSRRLDREVIG